METKYIEKGLLEIVGKELSAKSYAELLAFLSNCKIMFTNELRIEIQEQAKEVGGVVSGYDFELWLNKSVAERLSIINLI